MSSFYPLHKDIIRPDKRENKSKILVIGQHTTNLKNQLVICYELRFCPLGKN